MTLLYDCADRDVRCIAAQKHNDIPNANAAAKRKELNAIRLTRTCRDLWIGEIN